MEENKEQPEKPKVTSLFHSNTNEESVIPADQDAESEEKTRSSAWLKLKKLIGPGSDPQTAHIPYTSEKLNKNGFRVINGKVQKPKSRGS